MRRPSTRRVLTTSAAGAAAGALLRDGLPGAVTGSPGPRVSGAFADLHGEWTSGLALYDHAVAAGRDVRVQVVALGSPAALRPPGRRRPGGGAGLPRRRRRWADRHPERRALSPGRRAHGDHPPTLRPPPGPGPAAGHPHRHGRRDRRRAARPRPRHRGDAIEGASDVQVTPGPTRPAAGYLVDPAADGAALLDLPGGGPEAPVVVGYGAWPDATAVRVELPAGTGAPRRRRDRGAGHRAAAQGHGGHRRAEHRARRHPARALVRPHAGHPDRARPDRRDDRGHAGGAPGHH